jgi:predicted TIM-barrel fold metal-dependent hydrolase
MGDLLLRDYAPRSAIVTAESVVERPRYPAIDAHNHLGFRTDAFGEAIAEGGMGAREDADELVGIMDECGIRAMANLTGRWGDDLKALLERFEGRHPGRFYTFCNVDWSRAVDAGFGERAAAQLEESVAAGARGLKIFKNLGLKVRDTAGALVMPDDERLAPLWARAGELGVPVLIHVADPPAFFEPLDGHNPAYLSLTQRPEWHFYGPEYPGFLELVEAGIRLMARHPDTTFITAHTGWYTENLAFVAEQMLDRLPNMVTDFSARINTLGIQPYAAREFFIKYQDRILFGTDNTPSEGMFRTYYRFLETRDDYFESSPGRPLSRIYGLGLPDEVLEKVYRRNAERVIPGLG